MGSVGSIQVLKSIEVSFVNPKTGKIFPEEKIMEITNKACKEFDYKQCFYDAYKHDIYGNNPYQLYANRLKNHFTK